MKYLILISVLISVLISCETNKETPIQISGVYPHLAYYNSQGECGTGAVVPWAERLWVITYSHHFPKGSDDKLYEITPSLEQITREESIGGTPANRMIHKESKQLFIGPYAIDEDRNVRAIPYAKMGGRHTGNARHLSDPANKIYYASMEEGFYEVNTKSLEVTTLYEDKGVTPSKSYLLEGAHGKGLYSGQEVLVYSNNGEASQLALERFDIEAGLLAEWDGKGWKAIRRNQFVEVTGPGGIYGNEDPANDPIWVTGWDHKSLIVGVRNVDSGWSFYRLPKASHSYDGAHGWNTEWPRIRDVGTADNPAYLMTMHGMFWAFPEGFNANDSKGIRPRSAYLKVIGDYARWNDQLVFGCDDSAQKEFLNKRRHKGGIEGPGQSNSNLWFTSPEKPDQLGPKTASGAVWLNEEIKANKSSEPFLFAGWENRSAWIQNEGPDAVEFIIEVDKMGNQKWENLKNIRVGARSTRLVDFDEMDQGEWIRVTPTSNTVATLNFNYSDPENRFRTASSMFEGLANVNESKSQGGLLYGLGDNRRALGIATLDFDGDNVISTGYYELDANLNLVLKEDPETEAFIKSKFAIPENVIQIEESSVLIIDDKERRWRLPLGNDAYKPLTDRGHLRICREVATERDLFNSAGTFYELPAENADGFAKIRPIASHDFRIHDYASYRGLLVMTGLSQDAKAGAHIVRSKDGNAAVWLGVIDDLWELGKPRGQGGPWSDSEIKSGIPSDPYLIGHYDNKYLELSHASGKPVTFKIEVEPIGHGPWMLYQEVVVKPGETFKHNFSGNFQARWIRFVADKDCKATAWLKYY